MANTAPEVMPSNMDNKYAPLINSNLEKVLEFADKFANKVGRRGIEAICMSAATLSVPLIMGAIDRASTGNFSAPLLLGAVAMVTVAVSSIALAVAANAVLPKLKAAEPLKNWERSEPITMVAMNDGKSYLEIPGHPKYVGTKEMDAFSLPELTEIVSSFKDYITVRQSNTLRRMIGETRHADHVDELANPLVDKEMRERFDSAMKSGVVEKLTAEMADNLKSILQDPNQMKIKQFVSIIEHAEGQKYAPGAESRVERKQSSTELSI